MTFDIDLAGFSTGIVEEYDIVDGKLIKEGDIIIGLKVVVFIVMVIV